MTILEAMTDTDDRATPHIPAIVPRLNPLIRRLLGAGLPFGPNVLLTVRGRSSGLARTFPVAILEVDSRRFIQSPFGEVNWVRNLRADGSATVAKGDSAESVEAVELTPEAAGPVLRDALAPYLRWRIGAFVIGRYFHVRPGSPIEDYIAIARLHPMFELLVRTAY
jgi:deazaflavin-dependent oxidoreductase (nitroreductase family)